MSIEYAVNAPVSAEQFIDLLNGCSLGVRRPIENLDCIKGMLANADLTISAWSNETLVGIARSVTDFHYACYLSDLAVLDGYQSQGIGQKLIEMTQQQLKPTCNLILLAAPAANDYYPKLGFNSNPRCWVLPPQNHSNS